MVICFLSTAKGRTNVELREQFTLAPGVSQSMTAFKEKRRDSPGGDQASVGSGQRDSVSGPVVKVSLAEIFCISDVGLCT